jgi:hypothetical protein
MVRCFPALTNDEDGRPVLYGQQMPRPEQTVVWMDGFLRPSRSEATSKGVYGLLSTYVHPTAYTTRELFVRVEHDGHLTAERRDDVEFHERLAKVAVVPSMCMYEPVRRRSFLAFLRAARLVIFCPGFVPVLPHPCPTLAPPLCVAEGLS